MTMKPMFVYLSSVNGPGLFVVRGELSGKLMNICTLVDTEKKLEHVK